MCRFSDLVYARDRHEAEGGGGVALGEEQDIVYREHPRTPAAPLASGPPAPRPSAPREAEHRQRFLPDEAMVFRYSALLFNAHRIHYDRDRKSTRLNSSH